MHIHVAQPPDEQLHRSWARVHCALENGLIPNVNSAFHEPSHRLGCEPDDLIGMIEVSVNAHILLQRPGMLDHTG
jgi:hypothetical protein